MNINIILYMYLCMTLCYFIIFKEQFKLIEVGIKVWFAFTPS